MENRSIELRWFAEVGRGLAKEQYSIGHAKIREHSFYLGLRAPADDGVGGRSRVRCQEECV